MSAHRVHVGQHQRPGGGEPRHRLEVGVDRVVELRDTAEEEQRAERGHEQPDRDDDEANPPRRPAAAGRPRPEPPSARPVTAVTAPRRGRARGSPVTSETTAGARNASANQARRPPTTPSAVRRSTPSCPRAGRRRGRRGAVSGRHRSCSIRRDALGFAQHDGTVPGPQFVRPVGEEHHRPGRSPPTPAAGTASTGRCAYRLLRPHGDVEDLELGLLVPQHRHLPGALAEGEAGHLLGRLVTRVDRHVDAGRLEDRRAGGVGEDRQRQPDAVEARQHRPVQVPRASRPRNTAAPAVPTCSRCRNSASSSEAWYTLCPVQRGRACRSRVRADYRTDNPASSRTRAMAVPLRPAPNSATSLTGSAPLTRRGPTRGPSLLATPSRSPSRRGCTTSRAGRPDPLPRPTHGDHPRMAGQTRVGERPPGEPRRPPLVDVHPEHDHLTPRGASTCRGARAARRTRDGTRRSYAVETEEVHVEVTRGARPAGSPVPWPAPPSVPTNSRRASMAITRVDPLL
ncbi:hypothetical protein TPAU25S_00905 [Tsukamurella paurometabola]